MGTRCLTIVKDGDNRVMVMYRQYDGYPNVHGKSLAEMLKGKVLVNGFQSKDEAIGNFNGVGCMAASIVAKFKKGIGGFYLYPTDVQDCGQDYVYTLYAGTEKNEKRGNYDKPVFPIMLKVEQYEGKVLYDGPADDFDASKIKEG